MSYKISYSHDFTVEAKRLKKRYHSFMTDLEEFQNSLQENPFQGVELFPNIRKIRIPIKSKGRGKAGSARVITANAIIAEHQGKIALLTIYDKSDFSTVDLNIIKQMARELGFI